MSLDDDATATGRSGVASDGPWPTCTHCGRREARRAHTLRFVREERGERVVDLQLCEDCVADVLDEPGVERVRTSSSSDRA